MQITEMLLTNPNARPGTRITPRGLVIHWTANEGKGANAIANRNYFNRPTTVASAHYIVCDKQIVRCLPENEMGYHVGAQSYKPAALERLSSYPNNCTIGIEMCVNADGDFRTMYRNTLELAADILHRYGWGVDKLWRHYDITGKNCPAFFATDDYAQKYVGQNAAEAWEQFKKGVHSLLTGYTQKSQSGVDNCDIQVTLPVKGRLRAGASYLPVRAVAEAAGGKVEWDAGPKKVTVNGKALPVTIENGTAYSAARELAALLDMQVEWEQDSRTVRLVKQRQIPDKKC